MEHFAKLSDHTKGIIYGILSAISVSGYVLINRHVYNQYDVGLFNYAVTFAASAGLFAVVGLLLQYFKNRETVVTLTTARQLLTIGVAGGLAMALIAVGQNYTTAVNAGIVMTTSILTTSVFSAYFLKEKFSAGQWRWLVIMFVGLYLGVVGLHLVSFRAGDLIIIAAMVVLGFNNTFSKRIIKKHDGSFVADARLTISAALMLAIGFAILGTDVLVVSAGLWPLLAGMFLWLCIRTFYKAIQHSSPNQTIVLNNTQIFFTAIAGVLLLSEAYDWVKFLGSAVVLVSVYFISKK